MKDKPLTPKELREVNKALEQGNVTISKEDIYNALQDAFIAGERSALKGDRPDTLDSYQAFQDFLSDFTITARIIEDDKTNLPTA